MYHIPDTERKMFVLQPLATPRRGGSAFCPDKQKVVGERLAQLPDPA